MLEAWRNSDIHPVQIKTEAQQQLIALHRVRSTWIATRTARINTSRGILREFGIVVANGASRVPARVTELIEDANTELPMGVRDVLNELVIEIRQLTSRIENVERQLAALADETPVVERLCSIPGVGLLTATALIAFVGNVERFPSSRHFSCYLGLTPREHSSGLRRQLGQISKRGDVYIRMLLTHGARSVLRAAKLKSKPDKFSTWALDVHRRRGHNKASIAVANKMARIVWAVWKHGKPFGVRSLS